MKIRTFAIISMLLLSLHVGAQVSMLPTANSMSNSALWTALTSIDVSGNTMFGKCKVLNATTCASCACDYYFRANIVGSLGMYGWPKNPSSGDSTGCLGNGCWGGYTAPMCTADNQANARAMLLDALNKNACGTPVPPVVVGGINIQEVSKFFFIDPAQNGGKIECGTNDLGSKVGESFQFSKLPGSTCRAAYHVALKSAANGRGTAKYISRSQLNSNTISTTAVLNAASVIGQLNTSYNIYSLAIIQPFLDMTATQYAALSTSDVALFYVALNESSNLLPATLKPRVKPNKFDDVRAAGDDWITRAEIDAAKIQLATIAQGEVTGKNLSSISEAVNYLQSQTVNAN